MCVLRSSRLSKDSDPEGHLLHILLVHPRSPSRARVNPPDQWPLGPLLWSCWPSWDSVQKLVQAAATVLSCSLCGGVQIGTDDDLWPLLPWTETPKHSCSPPSRDTIVLSYLLGCFPPRGTHLAAVKVSARRTPTLKCLSTSLACCWALRVQFIERQQPAPTWAQSCKYMTNGFWVHMFQNLPWLLLSLPGKGSPSLTASHDEGLGIGAAWLG